jgi:molybdopterin-containing oxidoreductase family membrane subunit
MNRNIGLGVFAIGLLLGLYAYFLSFTKGVSVFGADHRVPWGLLISTYVFFVLTSTGLCFITSLGHVFGVKRYELIAKRGVLLAIITLLAGFFVLAPDLGRMERLPIYFLLSPNFSSAIWWMGFWYSTYLVLMVTEFAMLHKENYHKARIVGGAAFISAILAHSTLGSVFGLVEPRAYWFGAWMPLYFLLTAFLSGVAAVILVTFATYKLKGEKMGAEMQGLVVELGKILGLTAFITLLFVSWKTMVGLWATNVAYKVAFERVVSFMPFGLVEIVIGLLIPLLIVLSPGTRTVTGISTASLLVIIALFIGRYDMVAAGQVVPSFEQLWFGYLEHAPTFAEYLVVIGAFSLVALLYILADGRLKLGAIPAGEVI